ncbi:protein kinase, partial [Myxococcota bacterium]|nr:protein kinase [Myxococcota bacterium]MBU1511111.1 protein kinase [Myxococcota bacterium]
MPCIGCNTNLPTEARFCPRCGMPQKQATPDSKINIKLDERYLLLELLGEGGSGKVYLARHVQLGKRVAVKVLHRSLVHDGKSVERFRKEAQSVANLDNPHIIQVFDYGQTPTGSPYIAMELLHGETFAARLNARKLTLDELLGILSQIADGLGEAHALGFIHRDLRPRNIMLIEREGQKDYVKILDFGLAKIVHPGSDPSVSGVGFVLGDPTYSAPEQMKAQKVDGRADLYSLGIMVYQALAGHPPYTGATVFEVMGKHLDAPLPMLEGSSIAVPRGLDAVLAKALAKNPNDRYRTVLQFLEAMMELRNAPLVQPLKAAKHPVFIGTNSYLNLQPAVKNDQTPVLARMPGGGVLNLPPGTP